MGRGNFATRSHSGRYTHALVSRKTGQQVRGGGHLGVPSVEVFRSDVVRNLPYVAGKTQTDISTDIVTTSSLFATIVLPAMDTSWKREFLYVFMLCSCSETDTRRSERRSRVCFVSISMAAGGRWRRLSAAADVECHTQPLSAHFTHAAPGPWEMVCRRTTTARERAGE